MTQRQPSIDEMGTQIKAIERRWAPIVPRSSGLMVRLDGKNFSSWTKEFESPFDSRISDAFDETLAELMREYRPAVGYTQSDEISLSWFPPDPGSTTEHVFGGKTLKIASVLASSCTAIFNDVIEWKPRPALFDARVFAVTLDEGILATRWRIQDALRNGVNSVASSHFSHRELMGVSTGERRRLLADKGVDLGEFDDRHMGGLMLGWDMVEMGDDRYREIPEQHRPAERPLVSTLVPVDPVSALRNQLQGILG